MGHGQNGTDGHVTPGTEGQRLLLARRESLRELSELCGTSTATISRVRAGLVLPGVQARAQLEALGIPRDAWDRPPPDAIPASRRPPMAPLEAPAEGPSRHEARQDAGPGRRSVLEELDTVIDSLRSDLRGSLAAQAKGRLIDSMTRALGQRARIEREAATFEADVVRRAPFFRRATRAILEALRPFPDAARAVAEALARISDDGPPVQGALDDEDDDEDDEPDDG